MESCKFLDRFCLGLFLKTGKDLSNTNTGLQHLFLPCFFKTKRSGELYEYLLFVRLPAGDCFASSPRLHPPFSAKRTFAKYKKPSQEPTLSSPPLLVFPRGFCARKARRRKNRKGGGEKSRRGFFPASRLARKGNREKRRDCLFQGSYAIVVVVVGSVHREGLSPAADSPTDRATMEKGILSLYLPSFFREFVFLPSSSFFAHNRSGGRASRSSSSLEQDPFDKFSPLPSPPPPLSPFCQRAEGMIRLPPTYLLLQTRGGTRSKFTFVQNRRLLKKGPLL